jgi:hypothetical protein
LIALALMLAAPAAAQQGAFLTEAAGCEAGHHLEAGAQRIAAEPNFLTGQPRARWDVGVLRATTCIDGRAQFDLEWTARVGADSDPAFGEVSDFGDVVVRAELRLAGGPVSGRRLAARITTALPQTRFGDGLGSNTLRFSTEVLASAPVQGWRLDANLGLALLDEALRAHEQRDLLTWGLQVARPLGAGASSPEAVIEASGRTGDGAPGADARGELRIGLRVPRGRATWSAALRRGIAGASGTWGAAFFGSWRLGIRAGREHLRRVAADRTVLAAARLVEARYREHRRREGRPGPRVRKRDLRRPPADELGRGDQQERGGEDD